MKSKLIAISALAVLAACSQKPAEEPAQEPAATETAAAVVADPALTNEDHIGTWETMMPDGTVEGMTTIKADGTYDDVAKADGKKENGSWAMEAGKTCFDPEGDDPAQPKHCYVVGAAAEDGWRPLQRDDGALMSVRKTS